MDSMIPTDIFGGKIIAINGIATIVEPGSPAFENPTMKAAKPYSPAVNGVRFH